MIDERIEKKINKLRQQIWMQQEEMMQGLLVKIEALNNEKMHAINQSIEQFKNEYKQIREQQ